MKLRRLDKAGNEMFCKEYTDKKLAKAILETSANHSTGEVMWEVVPDAPKKSMGRPKKNKYEDN
tara:strand:+ start:120 stop:311 length:192 start_codon:yes stop_codon:yes gene_type:complete